MNSLKVAHVITGLNVGGAEQMLARLLPGLQANGVSNVVVSLAHIGPLGAAVEAAGIPVHALDLPAGRIPLRGVWALARLLRAERPAVAQGWMYHANLLTTLAAPLADVGRTLWNIRSASADLKGYGRATALTIRAGALLSSRPLTIVTNSNAARIRHEALGYHPRQWTLISNGFDLQRFRPDPEAYGAVRRELGLPPKAWLVGHFGRFHPVKRHDLLLAAAANLLPHHADLHFLLAGTDVVAANPALAGRLPSELEGRVRFLGERADVARLMAALNVAVLCSDSESFPNVVGEAMACGVPCVVTDVGDAAEIVGDTGRIIKPGDTGALAAELDELLRLPPATLHALGAQARARVAAQYDLARVVEVYAALYRAVAGEHGENRLPSRRGEVG